MKKNWYAIYTKPHCEKKVASLLSKKKIENYCPLNRILANFSTNKKKISFEPLLSTFVFVYVNDLEMNLVKRTDHVIDFVYWLGKPAIIQNDEILKLQYFTNKFSNLVLEKTVVNRFEIGKQSSEPKIDINRKFVYLNDSHIELYLPSLGYRIIAEIRSTKTDIFYKGVEGSKLAF
jgi:transcription antitermination factor NusG